MPQYIIHHEGAFNVYCTVSDGVYFEPALTLTELETWYREKYGSEGMRQLPERLQRAIATGCSAYPDVSSLDYCISMCRGIDAPEKWTDLKKQSRRIFLQRFLTLSSKDAQCQHQWEYLGGDREYCDLCGSTRDEPEPDDAPPK